MGVIKPRRIDDKEKGKRALYSEGAVPGASKLSGVNKTFLLAALPYSQENYSNIKLLLSQLDMSDMKPTFSPDMKMAIYMIGKVYSTCKFPCIFGSGSSPWVDVCDLLTVGDSKMWYARFMAAGGKGTGIEFASFVYEILFQYPDETLLIDILNFPELHVMLGIVQKILDYIQLLSSTKFIDSIIHKLNITETYHRGKKGLNGNACKKLLENPTLITIRSKALPDTCDKVKIAAAAKTLSLFGTMVHSSFGNLVVGDWRQDITNFCASYRALPGISYPPKFHLVEGHLQQWLERRWSQDKSYEGFGCGYWSEQPFEALHDKFDQFWTRYKVGREHEDFGKTLRDAVMSWNSRKV